MNFVHLECIITSLAFLVSKITLPTLLAQLVSILRAKLWKVVMKCKKYFLALHTYIWLSTYIFEVASFFSPSASPINSIFFVANIYKIHIFDETFFFLATVGMITDKLPWQPL